MFGSSQAGGHGAPVVLFGRTELRLKESSRAIGSWMDDRDYNENNISFYLKLPSRVDHVGRNIAANGTVWYTVYLFVCNCLFSVAIVRRQQL
jgi:hypothetical protein